MHFPLCLQNDLSDSPKLKKLPESKLTEINKEDQIEKKNWDKLSMTCMLSWSFCYDKATRLSINL